MKLNTKRQMEIELIKSGQEYFVRTREVAGVLGVKQPFEFCSNVRKVLGDKAILTGERTEAFRNEKEDEARTTFINIRDLYTFLVSGTIYHKMIPANVASLKRELLGYI